MDIYMQVHMRKTDGKEAHNEGTYIVLYIGVFLYKKFEDNEMFKSVSDMRKRSMRKIAEITKCIVYERYSSVFKLLKRTFKALRLTVVEEDWNAWYATYSLDVFHFDLNRFYSNITENIRTESITTDSKTDSFLGNCNMTSFTLLVAYNFSDILQT